MIGYLVALTCLTLHCTNGISSDLVYAQSEHECERIVEDLLRKYNQDPRNYSVSCVKMTP